MDGRRRESNYVEEDVESKLTDKELILRLLGYLRPYRLLLTVAVAFLFISKAMEALAPLLIGRMTQTIMSNASLASAERETVLWHVMGMGGAIVVLLVSVYLLDSCNVFLKSWVGQNGLYTLRQKIYDHIIRMPIAYYDKHSVGRLMTRTIHDVDQINQMFSEGVIPIIGNIFLFASIVVGLFFINWHVAFLFVALLPIVWWLTNRFRLNQRRCYERVRKVVSAMNTFVQETLMGASVIRNFGLQNKSRTRLEEINKDYCDAYVESVHHFSFFISGIEFLQTLSLVLAFALIVVFSPASGAFDAGAFFAFNLYALMFFRPLSDLAERYNLLQSAMAAAARIFHVLDTPSEKVSDLGREVLHEVQSIHFDNVWFAYEDENWVLKGLTLKIAGGETVAIVGKTGEGKSTIMSLLLRFYTPQKGRILINGADIKNYTLDSLRDQFSLVLQDPVIFTGTIADNITLFNDAIGEAGAAEAVNYLGVESIIDRFPKGINHLLHEGGKGLSVGEMQLVSLARAVAYRSPVLMLDEATASIDQVTEHMMQRALKRATESRTALIIAHRLATIRNVGTIAVLQGGRIVELGTHAELLALQGVYEKLYRLQS